MSEYQYYEFLALDRPLTEAEYDQVRALSTRAEITRTRFVNEYHWGDFHGDPSALMDRYYDAHLYFADWGTRVLMFRLPLPLLELETAEKYCDGAIAIARRSGKNVVLEWRSDDEDRGEIWEDGGAGSLAMFVGLRSELAAGDLRPLYLAWLASVGKSAEEEEDEWSFGDEGEDEDEDGGGNEDGGGDGDDRLEPPVPEGLNSLTAAQHALVDFLRMDQDLLAVAAVGSPSSSTGKEVGKGVQADFLGAWLKSLTVAEKDKALRRLLSDDDPYARAELLRAARPRPDRHFGAPRAVSALLEAAAIRADAREEARRQEVERQRALREDGVRQEREQRLAALSDQGLRAWNEVSMLVAARTAKSYEAAVGLLSDLETISRRGGDPAAFARRVADLRAVHQRKSGFIDRLDAAGLP